MGGRSTFSHSLDPNKTTDICLEYMYARYSVPRTTISVCIHIFLSTHLLEYCILSANLTIRLDLHVDGRAMIDIAGLYWFRAMLDINLIYVVHCSLPIPVGRRGAFNLFK